MTFNHLKTNSASFTQILQISHTTDSKFEKLLTFFTFSPWCNIPFYQVGCYLLIVIHRHFKKLLCKKLVLKLLPNCNWNTVDYCSHNNRGQRKNQKLSVLLPAFIPGAFFSKKYLSCSKSCQVFICFRMVRAQRFAPLEVKLLTACRNNIVIISKEGRWFLRNVFRVVLTTILQQSTNNISNIR